MSALISPEQEPMKILDAASRRDGSMLIPLAMVTGLYLAKLYGYLLFHSLVEMFAIAVTCGIFMITWNARRFMTNGYFLFVGSAYLFVGVIDLLHTLAYKGMGVFPRYDANLPTQLWIAARYLQSGALLAAPFFIERKVNPRLVVSTFALIASLLIASIFGDLFPDCFVEGRGLTTFKVGSEYVVVMMLVGSLILLRRKRQSFDPEVVQLLAAAIIALALTELVFTLYVDVYGILNMVGHLFKLGAFYLIYLALIETGLKKPYNLLFRELKQSEERYRRLYMNTPVMLHSIDQGGRLVSVSNYWLEHLGFTRDEVLGRNATDFLTEESRRYAEDEVLPAFSQSGLSRDIPYQVVKKDGSVMDVLLTASAEADEKGGIIASLAVMTDVTEQKRAEEGLRKSEEKFARAFHTAPSIMVLATLDDGVFIEVNEAFEKTFGWRCAEVKGHSSQEFVTWENPSDRVMVLAMLRDNREVRNLEIPFRTKTGETFIGLYSADIIMVNGEKCLLSIAEDITELKRAREQIEILNTNLSWRAVELESANEQLAVTLNELESVNERLDETNQELLLSNQELEAFNYSVTHDLRNPLNNISGISQVLLELSANSLDANSKGFLTSIVEETQRMDHLIKTLLNFSRITRTELSSEEIDLSNLARSISVELQFMNQQRSVVFSIAEGIHAVGDPALLTVLLKNLLGNAWKYTGKTKAALITFGQVQQGGETVYFVQDNGCGFDMKDVHMMFHPFRRLHQDTDFEGTGIGLATVQRIVQRHGGKVWAEGVVGKGATVYFTLASADQH
jgi:PAS domain S-box-containing protein